MWSVLLEDRDSIFLPAMQILTGPISYLIWCSVQLPPQLYLVLWQSAPSFYLTVFIPVDKVIEAAKKALYTGHIGDGKIFVYNVENAIRISTGAEGYDALQD